MSVKRYRMFRDSIADCCCEIDSAKDGSYILASDYDALAQRCERLEKALAFYDSRGRCDYAGPCEYRAALASHDSKESKK